MKSCGPSQPRRGCRQRISASTPVGAPVVRSTAGCNASTSWSSVFSASRSSASRASWSVLAASRAESYAATLPPPSLAWYMAMSARRSSSVRSAVPASATTTPTETSTDIRTPATSVGAASRSAISRACRSAYVIGAARSPITGTRRQQQRELVAAEAGEQVPGAGEGAQPVGGQPQQLVAGGVPEGVVDLLELVDVEQQQRDRVVVGELTQRLVALAEQGRPVRQPGELVVHRLVRRAGGDQPQLAVGRGVVQRGGERVAERGDGVAFPGVRGRGAREPDAQLAHLGARPR